MRKLIRPLKEVSLFALCVSVFSVSAIAQTSLKSVLIKNVPHVKQRPDFCGEACAEMYLKHLGSKVDQNEVFNRSGLDPLQGRGCYTRELAPALRDIGFKIGKVWIPVKASNASKEIKQHFRSMHADLLKKIPSIVCMRTGEGRGATEHFCLVLGFDAKTDELIYHEPAVQGARYQRIKRVRFLNLWPLKYRKDRWTVIRFRLESGRLKKSVPYDPYSDAEWAQHILKLKKKLPQSGFTILIQKPFVVVGDGPSTRVKRRATGTVKWAVDHLKRLYFKDNPKEILDIWLFKDRASYRKNNHKLFKSDPGTPYGYYSSTHKALVMNIATGGGTLVHEIVHPFMAANFPECPSWFNEGLASLYEQSAERSGRIVGLPNWRLAGLQRAIRSGKVPSFKTLTTTTTDQFYNEDPGTNYSQARYLCYYLQQEGKLVKYYQQFKARCKRDPTGYRTLQKVLGVTDMVKFKKKWEAYVSRLKLR